MEYKKLINIPNDWGVGLLLTKHTIDKFIKNSPAFHSDLLTNDIIVEIDNINLEDTDIIYLKGPPNSTVDIKCLRNNNIIETTLKRSISLKKKWYIKDFVKKL